MGHELFKNVAHRTRSSRFDGREEADYRWADNDGY